MNGNEYAKLALRTMASQEAIRLRNLQYGAQATQVDNAVRGLANDVGEIAEATKNWLEYGKPFDPVNLKEEVGDVLWRLAQLCDACGFTLEEAMQANIEKLKIRFPQKYSDEQADPEKRDRAAERAAIAQDALNSGQFVVGRELPKGGEPGPGYVQQDGPRIVTGAIRPLDGRKLVDRLLKPDILDVVLEAGPAVDPIAREGLLSLTRIVTILAQKVVFTEGATTRDYFLGRLQRLQEQLKSHSPAPTPPPHAGASPKPVRGADCPPLPPGVVLNHGGTGGMCASCATPLSDEVLKQVAKGKEFTCPECKAIIRGAAADAEG